MSELTAAEAGELIRLRNDVTAIALQRDTLRRNADRLTAERNDLRHRLEEIEALDAARAADGRRVSVLETTLRRLEWSAHEHGGPRCPACPGTPATGHDDRCWLGTILAFEPGPAYEGAVAALMEGEHHGP